MDNTIIQQGKFTSDGNNKLINLRSDVDWMEVINKTKWEGLAPALESGVRFEWQRGLANGEAIEYTKTLLANTLEAKFLSSGGFTLIDPSASGATIVGTTISKASPPVCTTAAPHGLKENDEVIFTNLTNMQQLGGVIFTVGNVTSTTFELKFFDTNTANFTAETAYTVQVIPYYSWNNGWNYISSITTGATTQVQLTSNDASAAYQVGDVMRFNVESDFGMTQINGKTAKVLSYDAFTNTYTVDLDSSSYSAFAWPAVAAIPFVWPTVNKVGNENTSPTDATDNISTLSMQLEAGIHGPAGEHNDVIYWRAGKSFSVDNQ